MTYSTKPYNGQRPFTTLSVQASDPSDAPPASGEVLPGMYTFVALSQGFNVLLSQVRPPEEFQPQSPAIPQSLTPNMIRALGTTELKNFYQQALPQKTISDIFSKNRSQVASIFPRGPESFASVYKALGAEIERLQNTAQDLENSWPSECSGLEEHLQPLQSRLAKLNESHQMLTRAEVLWPQIKSETEKWPEDVKIIWTKTRRLEDVVTPLVKTVREFMGGRQGLSFREFNRAVVDLKAETKDALETVQSREKWTLDLSTFLIELDQLMSQAVHSTPENQDWGNLGFALSEKLTSLERQQAAINAESKHKFFELSHSLDTLNGTGKEIITPISQLRVRVEAANHAYVMLWHSSVQHHQELAHLYLTLPHLMGRPSFLESLFLNLALGLGKIQARLSDLRQRLSLTEERLPDINGLRTEAENVLVSLGTPLPRTEELKSARKRLASLLKAVGQSNILTAVKTELEQARRSGREADREFNRGLVEMRKIRKDLDSTQAELKSITEEKILLEGQLSAARHGLNTAGRLKSLMLTKFSEKADLIETFERERWQEQLCTHEDTINQLVSAHQEDQRLNLELTSSTRVLQQEHQEMVSQVEGLEENISGLQEERNALTTNLQELEETRQTEVLHLESLQKNHNELSSRTSQLEKDKMWLSTLVSELETDKNQLTSLADRVQQERSELLDKVSCLEESHETLSTQVKDMDQQIKEKLGPFIQILGAALWRSQALLKRARTATTRLMAQSNLESDVREANLRLAAAAREMDITEMARAEKDNLDNLLNTKTEELSRATEIIEEIRADKKTSTKMNNHFKNRTAKMHQALNTLQTRYTQHVEQVMVTEDGLKGFITLLMSQMIKYGLKIDHLMAHFFEEARQAFPEQNQTGRDLAHALLEDSLKLAQETTTVDHFLASSPDAAEMAQLRKQLQEIQPVVAFLARSFVEGVAQLAQARHETNHLNGRITALQQSQEGTSHTELDDQQKELEQLRDQTLDLTLQRDELKVSQMAKDNQINTLKHELAQADQDLADNDGRLEASWAALNYLGTRTGDSMSSQKKRIDSQARQVDSMSLELKWRETQIKDLEDRQDKLALVYWTIISQALKNTTGNASSFTPYSFLTLPPSPSPSASEEESSLTDIKIQTFIGSSSK